MENKLGGLDNPKIKQENINKIEDLRKKLLDLQFQLRKISISRSIVMTNYQTCIRRFLDSKEPQRILIKDLKGLKLEINEIEEKGSRFLGESVKNFLQNKNDSKLLVIEIKDYCKAGLLEYLKSVIDDSIESFYRMQMEPSKCPENTQDINKQFVWVERPLKDDKEIIIIFYKPLKFKVNKDTEVFDIEYFNDHWNYQVIDDLGNSCYQENVRYIEEASQTIFSKMKSGEYTDLFTKMFIKSIKDTEVNPNFAGYLKKIILPTLEKQVDLCAEDPGRVSSR
jgi:hypothetical protein